MLLIIYYSIQDYLGLSALNQCTIYCWDKLDMDLLEDEITEELINDNRKITKFMVEFSL